MEITVLSNCAYLVHNSNKSYNGFSIFFKHCSTADKYSYVSPESDTNKLCK